MTNNGTTGTGHHANSTSTGTYIWYANFTAANRSCRYNPQCYVWYKAIIDG
jgi:hypothetical protein